MTSLLETGYQGVRPGQLVVHAMDGFAGAIGVSDSAGKCTPEYVVLDAQDSGISTYYYAYLLREMARLDFIRLTCPAVRERAPRVRWANLRVMFLPVPSIKEQTLIVRLLTQIDRRIRRYVRAKQKLIGLLEEQKQAVIHGAVTRGLDPSVRLKPSGVDWLGGVPEHWEVRRLKFLAHIKTGGRDTVDRKDDGEYPFFVRSQTIERIDSFSFDGEAVLTAGDGAGVAKVFHYVNERFDYHQRVYKFSNFRDITGRFFFHYFSTTLKYEAFRETAKSTVDSLRLPMLQNFPVVLPPADEQDRIVEWVDREASELDKSITTIVREIALLREYRTRLIADIVTGKLDVRDAAACLPDEPVDSDSGEDALLDDDLDGEDAQLDDGEFEEVEA